MPSDNQPLLRTLAPALRELERQLRAFLAARHRYPLTTMQRAMLEGLASDLDRQAAALQLEQPLLVIMLMGGTGVGKSTLLNALAGGSIAQASFTRPTTRDPVVYYHHSIQTTRLDPALQACRLAAHDRPALQQKILVDTPDLDSNDLANRDKLLRLLPVADIVLYVGSQEKYHDKLGWQLFREQRQRRAFAFVLNKWDRCVHPGAVGLRPDEDLLRDLKDEGFEHPLLFRTCAQFWVDHPCTNSWQWTVDRGQGDHAATNGPPADAAHDPPPTANSAPPVEGEQFPELVHWLEQGLNRLEIEAIKARGVSQLLAQLRQAMEETAPPDLTAAVERIRPAWSRQLETEAEAAASILLNTLDPYQKEIEHHFSTQRQKHFGGLMNWYLQLFNKLRYTGSTLRDQLPFATKTSAVQAPPEWNLARFADACSAAASEQHLHSRLKAMSNRLLVEADALGIPLALLAEPTEAIARLDWKKRYAQSMIEVITGVEQGWSNPTGARWWLQKILILIADCLPGIAFLVSIGILIWGYTMKEPRDSFNPWDLLIPAVVVLLVLVILHVAIAVLLPLRWQTIRAQFHDELRGRLFSELETHYLGVLPELAQEVLVERKRNEAFSKEINEVAGWLQEREQSASIAGLYGDTKEPGTEEPRTK